MKTLQNVLVTGGAGYVGAVLTPKLLRAGYRVTVFDLFIYGEQALAAVKDHPNLIAIKGDIRNSHLLEQAIRDQDAIIHLACISNDPSFELNPQLGKSINLDASLQLIDLALEYKVKRFIFASSSSVYGIKQDENVSEDLSLQPLTDYSRYKADVEQYLLKKMTDSFIPLIIRPATVCGYSPRQRLDLTVNILTNHAVNREMIKVFGGSQQRPNIHMEDITDLYVRCLQYQDNQIKGKIFNAGYENHSLDELAWIIKNELKQPELSIIHQPTDDIRSYHISSEKIKQELGFVPTHTIADAVHDLQTAFNNGLIPDPFKNDIYYNVERMKTLGLK